MTNQEAPEALRLAGLLELAPEDGVEPQTAEDAATELRCLHAENTALRQGYTAARLEIESLQARIKTMAEEHADELAVAHLDGRMQPAPAAAPTPPFQTADSVLEDAERYRWIAAHCRRTSEHWGGRWSIIVDGPAPKSHDSEDDFDAAIDAARKQGANHD